MTARSVLSEFAFINIKDINKKHIYHHFSYNNCEFSTFTDIQIFTDIFTLGITIDAYQLRIPSLKYVYQFTDV